MTSINDKSKTCFVHSDGEGGFVVKMCQPNGRPLEFDLDAVRAAQLTKQMASALAQILKPPDRPPLS